MTVQAEFVPCRYFSLPSPCLEGDKRPELAYQVGMTPSGTEEPRVLHDDDMLREIQNLQEQDKVRVQWGAEAYYAHNA
jgi:hypothetical protein